MENHDAAAENVTTDPVEADPAAQNDPAPEPATPSGDAAKSSWPEWILGQLQTIRKKTQDLIALPFFSGAFVGGLVSLIASVLLLLLLLHVAAAAIIVAVLAIVLLVVVVIDGIIAVVLGLIGGVYLPSWFVVEWIFGESATWIHHVAGGVVWTAIVIWAVEGSLSLRTKVKEAAKKAVEGG